MSDIDATTSRIADKLSRLRDADATLRVLGASHHRYALAQCRTETELSSLERRCGAQLPPDYRAFLMRIGDGINLKTNADSGAAGPGYGLYSVGALSDLPDSIRKPFPLNHSILQTWDLEQSDDYWAVWNDASGRAHHGSLPLAHYGCAIYAQLVLTGDASGTVWIVDEGVGDIAHFADFCRYQAQSTRETIHGGVSVADGPHSFSMWYEDWLDACLRTSTGPAPDEPTYLPNVYIARARPRRPECPVCGAPLPTRSAKECSSCGAKWGPRKQTDT